MASPTTPIEQHPDLVELRMRYDEAAQKPTLQILEGFSFLVGLFVAASPWIVGFAGLTTLAITNLIVGGALALLAIGFASAYGRTHGIAWVAPCLGVWTIIAPWVVSGNVATTRTILSNVIAGALALLLGLATALLGMRGAASTSGAREARRG
jgi:SPW repeat